MTLKGYRRVLMGSELIDLVVAGVKGYCDVHGMDSRECGAARELGGLAIAGLVVATLLSASHE